MNDVKARPLRFCMITTFYPPYHFGGDGIFVRLLANELAKRGHQVEIIHCIDAYQLLAKQPPKQLTPDHENIIVHSLQSPFGALSPLMTQQTGRPLLKAKQIEKILDRGFDVIHYHNISLVGGPKILEYGKAIKLYTIHEYWLVCPTHLLYKFNQAPCTSRDCLSCTLVYLRPPQWWRYSGLMESSLKQIDRFISPSRFGGEIHHRFGLDIPFVHIPNFVQPVASSSPLPGALTEAETTMPYFLFVGRLEKVKGLQTLIPLFHNNRNARLLIAGKGDFEAELREMAGVSDNIRFLGYQSDAQLQQLYRNAVALIVPSVCYELFSLVILEAFRVGTPVIARNIGGMPELIDESGGGFIYTTSEQLIAIMEQLLADRSYRDRIGARGLLAYQQHWTPEIHLARYLALIHEISATRAPAIC